MILLLMNIFRLDDDNDDDFATNEYILDWMMIMMMIFLLLNILRMDDDNDDDFSTNEYT